MFKGSFTALITPFKGGQVDEKAFQRLVEWQIAEGTHGLVPVGTTGESPTLSHDEHKHVIELCIKTAKKRVPVIAGAGSNSTAEAIDFTRHAKKAGADAVLHSTGYYNKPTQEGLYRHFKAISEAVDMPIFLYNVPVRTIVDISVATMARCAKLKNVVGVKDATANVARVTQQRLACGKNFIQLSGEDGTVLGFMAHGGHGCISVTSNVAPRLCAQFQNACLKGDFADGAGAAGQADAAARRAVRRDQPGAGEVCRLAARHHRLAGVPPAAGAARPTPPRRRSTRRWRASALLQAKAAE